MAENSNWKEIVGDLRALESLYAGKIISEENYLKQKITLEHRLTGNEFEVENTVNEAPRERRKYGWLIVSIIIGIFFCTTLYYFITGDSRLSQLTSFVDPYSQEKEEIQDQIKSVYFGLLNGAYTSYGMAGTGVEGIPVYDLDMSALMLMGMTPLLNLFGGSITVESKNIQVYEFIDRNTAKVKYDLSLTTDSTTKSVQIDMIVKKIGSTWKLDGKKFLGPRK